MWLCMIFVTGPLKQHLSNVVDNQNVFERIWKEANGDDSVTRDNENNLAHFNVVLLAGGVLCFIFGGAARYVAKKL